MPYSISASTRPILLLAATGLLALVFAFLYGVSQAQAAFEGLPTVTAFETGGGELVTYEAPEYHGESGTLHHTYDGIESGTSTSVTGYPGVGTSYVVAFHASGGSNKLWTYSSIYGSTGGAATPLGMEPGTSPSIAGGGPGS